MTHRDPERPGRDASRDESGALAWALRAVLVMEREGRDLVAAMWRDGFAAASAAITAEAVWLHACAECATRVLPLLCRCPGTHPGAW